MLTKCMARELGRQKVRVNCICPGVIRTHLAEALWKDEGRLKEFVKKQIPGPHRRDGRNRRGRDLLRVGRQFIHDGSGAGD